MEWSSDQEHIRAWCAWGSGHGAVAATAGSGKTTTIEGVIELLAGELPGARVLYLAFNRHIVKEARRRLAQYGARRDAAPDERYARGARLYSSRELPISVEVRTANSMGAALMQIETGLRMQLVPDLPRHLALDALRIQPHRADRDAWWRVPAALAFERAHAPWIGAQAPEMIRLLLADWLKVARRRHRRMGIHQVALAVGELVDVAMTDAIDAVIADDPSAYVEPMRAAIARRGVRSAAYEAATSTAQDAMIRFAAIIQARCVQLAEREGLITYAGQLYIPGLLRAAPRLAYDWVIVDEAQDMSPAALGLLEALVPPASEIHPHIAPTRLLAVGDHRQSIYLFSGADSDAFSQLIDRWRAHVMPLPVTYRCPRSHVRLCQQVAPEMQPAPGAAEGEVHWIEPHDIARVVEPGDLVLSRRRAPLVEACISLLAAGVPAAIRGRSDLARQIRTLARTAEDHARGQCLDIREAILVHARGRLKQLQDEARAAGLSVEDVEAFNALVDLVKVARIILEGIEAPDFDALDEQIKTKITHGKRKVVVLSTVHGAKGLEAERVVVLEPDRLPPVKPHPDMTAAQWEQEVHLAFVAASRSRRALYIVRSSEPAHPFWLGRWGAAGHQARPSLRLVGAAGL